MPLPDFTLEETHTRSAYTIRSGADRLVQAVSLDEETDDPRTHFPRQGLSSRATGVDVRSVLSHGLATLPAAAAGGGSGEPGQRVVAPVRRPSR